MTGQHGSIPYGNQSGIEPVWCLWNIKKNRGSFSTQNGLDSSYLQNSQLEFPHLHRACTTSLPIHPKPDNPRSGEDFTRQHFSLLTFFFHPNFTTSVRIPVGTKKFSHFQKSSPAQGPTQLSTKRIKSFIPRGEAAGV